MLESFARCSAWFYTKYIPVLNLYSSYLYIIALWIQSLLTGKRGILCDSSGWRRRHTTWLWSRCWLLHWSVHELGFVFRVGQRIRVVSRSAGNCWGSHSSGRWLVRWDVPVWCSCANWALSWQNGGIAAIVGHLRPLNGYRRIRSFEILKVRW